MLKSDDHGAYVTLTCGDYLRLASRPVAFLRGVRGLRCPVCLVRYSRWEGKRHFEERHNKFRVAAGGGCRRLVAAWLDGHWLLPDDLIDEATVVAGMSDAPVQTRLYLILSLLGVRGLPLTRGGRKALKKGPAGSCDAAEAICLVDQLTL